MNFESVINDFTKTATELFNNKEDMKKLLDDVMSKVKENEALGSALDDINLFHELIKDYLAGDYTEISKATIIKATVGFLYLISPIEILPDSLLGGFLDDLLVIAYIVKVTKDEVDKYREWKLKNTYDILGDVYCKEYENEDGHYELIESSSDEILSGKEKIENNQKEVVYYEIKRSKD